MKNSRAVPGAVAAASAVPCLPVPRELGSQQGGSWVCWEAVEEFFQQ